MKLKPEEVIMLERKVPMHERISKTKNVEKSLQKKQVANALCSGSLGTV